MASALSVLDGLLSKGISVASEWRYFEAQNEQKKRELEYKIAQENKAAAVAAAESARGALNSETIKTVIMWTVTTIAAAVLVKVVFNFAGLKG